MNRSLAARILCAVVFASFSALATEWVPPQVDALPGSVSDQASPASAQINPSKVEPMMIEPSAEQHAAAYHRDLAACAFESASSRQACRDAVDARYGEETGNLSARIVKCEALDGAAKSECLEGGTSAGQ